MQYKRKDNHSSISSSRHNDSPSSILVAVRLSYVKTYQQTPPLMASSLYSVPSQPMTVPLSSNRPYSYTSQGLRILQWNIRGFNNHKHNLEVLINLLHPHISLLQETHLKLDKGPDNFKNYICHFHNKPYNTNKSGIAILVKKSISHSRIPINSQILCNAIRIHSKPSIAIASLYMESSIKLKPPLLDEIVNQLQVDSIIRGDFNAHHRTWGNQYIDHRGKILEDWLANSRFSFLYDGSPTFVYNFNSSTTIDLTLVSSHLAPKFTWSSHDNPEGSDHIPILITSNIPIASFRSSPRFLENQANWAKLDACIAD